MKTIKNTKQFILTLIILLIILLTIMLISIALGSANIKLQDIIKIIVSKIPILKNLINAEEIPQNLSLIITNIRIPRILLAGLVGMGLSICGAVYQGILKNSMADPYILGISSGASLGATIAIILGNVIDTKLLAFILAVLTTIFVYMISKKTLNKNSNKILLTGMNINYFITAIISLLMIINRDQMQKIIFWTMGSFGSSMWQDVIILLFTIIPTTIILTILGKYINAIALDEKIAKTIGIDTIKLKGLVIILTCLITSLCVSTSGIIGFVGLMIPHIVRMLFTTDYKYLIPLSGLTGAIFLILSDDIARLIIAPSEIPIGIITAIIGSPFLIYLIYRKKKNT